MTAADQFDLVYNIADAPMVDVYWTAFYLGLGAVVTTILFLTGKRGWQVGLVVIGLFAVMDVAFVWVPHFNTDRAAAHGGCEQVTGVVEDYTLEPHTGHAPGDRFRVADRQFELSNFYTAPGYRRTVAYGGIHLAGRIVRMCVIGGAIARLDVQRQAWPQDMSRVRFRVKGDDAIDFSVALYGVTQRMPVRSYPAVWAKDFALSDFDVAIAGPCEGATGEVERLVDAASIGMGARADIVATYRATAGCSTSAVPPLRSWKPSPEVRLYGSDSDWTVATWE